MAGNGAEARGSRGEGILCAADPQAAYHGDSSNSLRYRAPHSMYLAVRHTPGN